MTIRLDVAEEVARNVMEYLEPQDLVYSYQPIMAQIMKQLVMAMEAQRPPKQQQRRGSDELPARFTKLVRKDSSPSVDGTVLTLMQNQNQEGQKGLISLFRLDARHYYQPEEAVIDQPKVEKNSCCVMQ